MFFLSVEMTCHYAVHWTEERDEFVLGRIVFDDFLFEQHIVQQVNQKSQNPLDVIRYNLELF